MIASEIPPATVEADGDDIVLFTCETCAAERDFGNVFVTGIQFQPDDETVAEFAVSVLVTGTNLYEDHWLAEHGS